MEEMHKMAAKMADKQDRMVLLTAAGRGAGVVCTQKPHDRETPALWPTLSHWRSQLTWSSVFGEIYRQENNLFSLIDT